MTIDYTMDFCKYCNDMLKITKNKHYKSAQAEEIDVETMVGLLIDYYKAEASSYYDNENAYTLNFSAKKLMIVNIDEAKELFPEKSEIQIRTDLKKLYDDIIRDGKDANPFNLTCKTCSISYHLRPDTLIDSTNYVNTITTTDESAEIRFDDPTLFRTKNYVCSNKECITRTDMSDEVQRRKEAVFYKPDSRSHSVKYICGECKSCLRT
jgi:hypothetical protein